MISLHISYDQLCSFNNIYIAWDKVRSGKADKKDVVTFEYHLEDNLIELYEDLTKRHYVHGNYSYFEHFDGKKRGIHKAHMRDRIVHQLVYAYLEMLYRPYFISDTYASRVGKGTHHAVQATRYFARLATNKSRAPCHVLKGDIRAYFNSINHGILLNEIRKKITDQEIVKLIKIIIESFSGTRPSVGVPLGNVTSQIFANIYLHPLDIFIKKQLRERYYIRYNDDFLIMSENKHHLLDVSILIKKYLAERLKLDLPDDKVSIRKLSWGVSFLGHVLLTSATIVGNSTKAKIFENLEQKNLPSYIGILKHANTHGLSQKVLADKRLGMGGDE